jgi:pilus assembly protein Flp/PilA
MRAHTRGRLVRWLRRDDGVSAVEYAILVGLIVVAVVAGIGVFSDSLGDYLSGLWDSLNLN